MVIEKYTKKDTTAVVSSLIMAKCTHTGDCNSIPVLLYFDWQFRVLAISYSSKCLDMQFPEIKVH